MTDLLFDTMIPSTKLAEIYFQQHGNEFSDGDKTVRLTLTDGFNVIKSTKDLKTVLKNSEARIMRATSDIHHTDLKLMKLRNEIEINANLFSEIEHLIRQVPIDDVLNCDLKLITQNILYSTTTRFTIPLKNNLILIEDDTPLAFFGHVVHTLRKYTSCVVMVSELSAVVGYLFVELCHKVGLKEVELVFIEHPFPDSKSLINIEKGVFNYNSGTVAVITENGDIDSAVDVLIETTVWHPWQLRRILVQENVYIAFKKAMRWKSKQESEEHIKFCAESFSYKGKKFYIDYTRTDRINEYIAVESYRTTKELLTLLNKYNNFYMSLWTNSFIESNEISQHVSANIIWINHFGVFDGPPQASQAIYNSVPMQNYLLGKFYLNKNWTIQRNNWLKLSFHERCSKIHFCLLESSENYSQLEHFLNCLRDWQPDSVYSDSSKACICTAKLRNLVCYKKVSADDPSVFTFVIRLLALGSAVLIDSSELNVMTDLNRNLSAIGAPIFTASSSEFVDSVAIEAVILFHNDFVGGTKAVYSNFGTIFAN